MHSRRKIALLIFISLIAIFFTLFQHFETSNETWVYWVFSRVLTESGKFIILQRSPPYTIYLTLFRTLGFPAGVTVEYIVTSLFTILGIVTLFKSYLGLSLSFFAALIWLPFMQISEPPVQKIALALSCLAIFIRQRKVGRFNTSLSYALLGLAYLFRPTYIFVIGLFLIYDLIRFLRTHKTRKLTLLMPQPHNDWPVLLIVSLYIIFQLFASPLPRNNIFTATTKWFPQKDKTEEIIQNYNWTYIAEKYKTFVGHDFYFTNRELFGGATDTIGAIRNNPKYVFSHISIFINQAIPMIAKMTNFASLDVVLLILVLLGAILAAKDAPILLFVLGNISMTFASILFMPQYRYLIFPMIPLFILASYWYGKASANILTKIINSIYPNCHCEERMIMRDEAISRECEYSPLLFLTTVIFLLLLSPNFTGANYYNRAYLDWVEIGKTIISDVRAGELRILDSRSSDFNSSMKESISIIYPLIKNCKGIMTLEYNFIGAFTDMPLNKIYDVWEIPPFGHLGDSLYNGLYPDRINCMLVSRELSLYEGFATNYQIRYQNYIKPFVEELLSKGAKSYDIPSYGQVVILN